MALVEIASQSGGYVVDEDGNALAGLTATISGATVYTDDTGTTPLTPLVVSARGYIPGYIEEGEYEGSVAGLAFTLHAVSGTLPARVDSVESALEVSLASYAALTPAAAIRQAITDAGVNGHIQVPAGTWTGDSTPIAPLAGQRFWGPGTIKRHAGSSTDLFQIAATNDVVIDCTLDGAMTDVIVGNTQTGSNGQTILAQTGNLVNVSGGSKRVKVRGRCQNNQGNAVRFFEVSRCKSSADIYNCIYGVLIGSQAGSSNACVGNTVHDCTIDTVGANAVFITGSTNSGIGANPVYGHKVSNVDIFQPGDSGIEIGMGAMDCVVTACTIDGNNLGFNGILVRDGLGHSIVGGTIKNFPMFANGSATYLTLGNGIFFWPSYTGAIGDCTVDAVTIKNCSRGVFAQGNNFPLVSTTTTADVTLPVASIPVTATAGMATTNGVANVGGQVVYYTSVDSTHLLGATGGTGTITSGAAVKGYAISRDAAGGAPGAAGILYNAGCTLTGVVVDGTQLGTVSGADQTTLNCHGFYIQSVSGFSLTNCVAKSCQDDGFRIGDSGYGSSYATDITCQACRAYDNGQQNVAAQTYYGFNLRGTSSQANVRLMNCIGSDTQSSHTQDYGFGWNSNGSGGMATAARLIRCTGSGNAIGLNDSVGIDVTKELGGGRETTAAASFTPAVGTSTVVCTGTTTTVNFPSATVHGTGRQIRIINQGSGDVTPARAATTFGLATVPAGTDHIYEASSGTNWD